MTGGTTQRLSHDPDLVPLYPSRKHFATLPSNADERLVRDTISLRDHNPAIVWPVRSFERRKVFQTLQNRQDKSSIYPVLNLGLTWSTDTTDRSSMDVTTLVVRHQHVSAGREESPRVRSAHTRS